MAYLNVDPITKKVKEYKNSGEWLAAVEASTAKPKAKPVGKMSFPEASKKLREEYGIDLRDSAEKEQIKFDEAVGKAVSAALARQQQQQATQASQARQETHSKPRSLSDVLSEFSQLTGWNPPKTTACGCSHAKHSKEGKEAVYSVGPVMGCQKVSYADGGNRRT